MTEKFINDVGNEVPKNTIMFLHTNRYRKERHNLSEIIEPLAGQPKRDWFDDNFYRCLPLTIANQYGFVLKSALDLTIKWDGDVEHEVEILFDETSEYFRGNDPLSIQQFLGNFKNGIMSIVNFCNLRTPPGINLMVIQPPNMINNPDLFVMSGVIETDNLRSVFTFNLRVLTPNKEIKIKRGDPIAAFIPIPRYFVENFELKSAEEYFDQDTLDSEHKQLELFFWERHVLDAVTKKYGSGRRYYQGIHHDDSKFKDHQKKIRPLISREPNTIIDQP